MSSIYYDMLQNQNIIVEVIAKAQTPIKQNTKPDIVFSYIKSICFDFDKCISDLLKYNKVIASEYYKSELKNKIKKIISIHTELMQVLNYLQSYIRFLWRFQDYRPATLSIATIKRNVGKVHCNDKNAKIVFGLEKCINDLLIFNKKLGRSDILELENAITNFDIIYEDLRKDLTFLQNYRNNIAEQNDVNNKIKQNDNENAKDNIVINHYEITRL
jgi:hypothetical protein